MVAEVKEAKKNEAAAKSNADITDAEAIGADPDNKATAEATAEAAKTKEADAAKTVDKAEAVATDVAKEAEVAGEVVKDLTAG